MLYCIKLFEDELSLRNADKLEKLGSQMKLYLENKFKEKENLGSKICANNEMYLKHSLEN